MTLPIASAPAPFKTRYGVINQTINVVAPPTPDLSAMISAQFEGMQDNAQTRALIEATVRQYLDQELAQKGTLTDVKVSYKGENAMEVGMFFCPYVPLSTVNISVGVTEPETPDIEQLSSDPGAHIFIVRRKDGDLSVKASEAVYWALGLLESTRAFEEVEGGIQLTFFDKTDAAKFKLLFA